MCHLFIKYLLINCLIAICLNSNGQNISDTINQLNNEGKRIGYWIEYVDETLEIAKKKKAVFYKYVRYDNGIKLSMDMTLFKKMHLVAKGNHHEHGKIVLLNGIYNLYNKDGKLGGTQYYVDGKLLSSKSFFSNGQVYEYIDYTDQYKGQKGSYKITIYKRQDALEIDEQYYFGKKENGKWELIKVL